MTNNFGVNRNFGFRRFILLDTVSKKNENTGQSLVEDDTVIVGVMFKCIKYNKGKISIILNYIYFNFVFEKE